LRLINITKQEKLVQGGVTWFVVPVHDDNKLWRHALAELKRQVEALKSDEGADEEGGEDFEEGDDDDGIHIQNQLGLNK
jgi:hypothetical protein